MQLYFTVTNMKKQKKCQTKLGFFVTVLLNKKLLKMTFFHVYPKFNDIFSEVKRRFKKFIMTTKRVAESDLNDYLINAPTHFF